MVEMEWRDYLTDKSPNWKTIYQENNLTGKLNPRKTGLEDIKLTIVLTIIMQTIIHSQ